MLSNYGGYGVTPGFQQTYELSAPGQAEIVTNATQGALSMKGLTDSSNCFETLDTNDNITSYVQANGDAHYEHLTASALIADSVLERTTNNGVSVDSVLCKDGNITVGSIFPNASSNIIIKLADNAGVNKLSIADSDGIEVASINSDGLFTGTFTDAGIYALLAGKAGGQTIYGGTASAEVLTIGGTALNRTSGYTHFIDTMDSAGSTGSAVFEGGVLIKKKLVLIGALNGSGVISTASNATASSASTGALIAGSGGIGTDHMYLNTLKINPGSTAGNVQGHLISTASDTYSLGQAINLWKDLYVSNGYIKATTATSSATTGALQCSGGIGTAGIFATQYNSILTSGGKCWQGHLTPVSNNAYDLGYPSFNWRQLYSTKAYITGTTASTSASTGAIICSGGLTATNIWTAGNITCGTANANTFTENWDTFTDDFTGTALVAPWISTDSSNCSITFPTTSGEPSAVKFTLTNIAGIGKLHFGTFYDYFPKTKAFTFESRIKFNMYTPGVYFRVRMRSAGTEYFGFEYVASTSNNWRYDLVSNSLTFGSDFSTTLVASADTYIYFKIESDKTNFNVYWRTSYKNPWEYAGGTLLSNYTSTAFQPYLEVGGINGAGLTIDCVKLAIDRE